MSGAGAQLRATTKGVAVKINPIMELLVAYAIVHLGLRGQGARKWAERQWIVSIEPRLGRETGRMGEK